MKRGVSTAIAIIILFISIPVTLAEGDRLVIDNQNIYEGMNSSYSKGYKPTVKGGKATIVLPLIYEGSDEILGNKIKVTPDLGSPEDSPFSYSNYEIDVSRAENKIDGGKSRMSSFLAHLEIPLAANRTNGIYPVIINTSFSLKSGKQDRQGREEADNQDNSQEIGGQVEQSFTVYVTIADGKDPNPPEPIPESEPEPEPRPQPKIIIEEYAVDPGVIMAGEPFDVVVKLKNTEKTWDAKNIKVTYKGETGDILPDSKTNTFFIDEIGKEKTHELTLHMKTRQDVEAKAQKILLAIEYEDSARTAYSVNEEILLEIRQPLRLELDEINIPSNVNAGDSLPITTNIFNMGRSTLYNVRCTIEMPGVIPDGSAYIGNMEPGTTSSAEIYAFFGTLDMGNQGEEIDDDNSNKDTLKDDTGKYGRSEGIMTITYEDEYGDEHTKIVELVTNIEEPIFHNDQDQTKEPEEKPDRASQWWVSIALALGIIMMLFGGISYKRKVDRLKKEYGHEDI